MLVPYTAHVTECSTECSCKAHLSAEVFWSHHWCTGLSPLAADTRAHRVQDRSADLQRHEWYGWHRDIWDHFVRVTDLPGRQALRSAVTNRLTVPAVKLSTIGSRAFSVSVLKRGTNYRKKSHLRHLYLPSNVTSRHSYSGNHFRTLLLIDTLVDLVIT